MSRRSDRTTPWGSADPRRGGTHAQAAVAFNEAFPEGTTLSGEELVEAGKRIFPPATWENKYTPPSFFARRINPASSIMLSEDERFVFVQNPDGTYTRRSLLTAFAGVDMVGTLMKKHASLMGYSDMLCQGVPFYRLGTAKREAVLNKYRFNQDAVGMAVGELLLQQATPKQALNNAIQS